MTAPLSSAVEQGAMAGRRYRLASPRRTPHGNIGTRLGRNAGASLEFRDHRDYQPGDDPRWIDWAAFARSEQLVVKLYHQEVHPHLDVLIDGSRSMALADTAKRDAALGLAAALVSAAENEGFSHTLYIARRQCQPLTDLRDPPVFDHDGSLGESLGRTPPRWRSGAIRVLISDLLFGDEPDHVMQRIAHGSAATFVMQVLAEADATPPQRGNIRLVDSETHEVREIFIDAAAQRRYERDLSRHQQSWAAAAQRIGGAMTTLIAETLVADWDLRELARVGLLTVD